MADGSLSFARQTNQSEAHAGEGSAEAGDIHKHIDERFGELAALEWPARQPEAKSACVSQ